MNKDTVKGKNILITGATSGIGKTIARQFAGEGARVVLVGRRQEILQKLKEELGENTITAACDLSKTDDINKIFQICKENQCKLNGLVHCAGIVAISSISSILNDPGMILYSMSKSALNSAVKTMSKEFMKRKIRVNGILPANVKTQMFLGGEDTLEDFMERSLERQPLGIIDTEQVSYLAEFLLSDNAKYITGECIVMSGGMTY